jgi:very-short-patch-repair endonuclease
MPRSAVFSHSTAALLYGIPLPLELENARALHISVPGTRRSVDAAGIVGHEVHLPVAEVGLRAGIPLTTPARTWCDLGALLEFGDLVAAGDFLLRRVSPLTDRSSLARAVDDYRSRRGIRNLRRALPLLSERSESRRESLLRIILIEAGLPSLEVNHEVFDDKGNLVARIDLAHPARKIAIEYEGDHHRTDKRQWRIDVARVRRLNAIGWRVTRATADDIEVDPRELLNDLRIHFAETDD